jgi:hypothetical protein
VGLLIVIVVDETIRARRNAPPKPPAFPENWIIDYEAMRDYIADNYANLEWSISEGRIDPYRLNVQTLAAIRAAQSDYEARRELSRFVRAFHDPHLALLEAGPPGHWYDKLREWARRPRSTTRPKAACTALGFQRGHRRLGFVTSEALERLSAFQKSESESFPAGIITLGASRFGFIRIPTFELSNYSESCERVWPKVAKDVNVLIGCDGYCKREIESLMYQDLVDKLSQQVVRLASQRIDAVVVDVTDNPGGSVGLSELFARALTTATLPAERTLLLKSGSAQNWLKRKSAYLHHARLVKGVPTAVHEWIDEGYHRSQSLLAEFDEAPCDRRVWFTYPIDADCSQLTKGLVFDGGLFAGLPRGFALSTRLHDDAFDAWLRQDSRDHVWGGPLIVLVNRHTCSAAESFTKSLHDYSGALLLGERTDGAGGGWMFGDGGLVLPYSRLRIVAPDHVLFLKDGRNARVGIEPDVCLDWTPGSSLFSKAATFLRALNRF